MSDVDLELYVTDGLAWDPKVDAVAIAVSADDGAVTLRGTVGSYRQKLEAKRAAEPVYGVTRVENKLQVRILNESKKEDAELRGDVLQALMLDSLVPATIDAKGRGRHRHPHRQRRPAVPARRGGAPGGNVFGVSDVIDNVELTYPNPDAGDVEHSVKEAFKRNAKLDADALSVATSSGTVTLDGVVRSWAEHDDAVSAAWAARGVTNVDDRIQVEY